MTHSEGISMIIFLCIFTLSAFILTPIFMQQPDQVATMNKIINTPQKVNEFNDSFKKLACTNSKDYKNKDFCEGKTNNYTWQ